MQTMLGLDNVDRYVREIIRNQDNLTYLSLLDPSSLNRCIYSKVNRFGLSTIAIKSKDMLPHQLLGIMSFRLREYLKLGWIDPNLVYNQKIFHEPLQETHDEDIHIISINHQTGDIVCYLCIYTMKRYGSLVDMKIGTKDRPLFPCEIAHGHDIFKNIDWIQDIQISSVRELKRFVKSTTKDTFGHRVSLEVLAGLASVTRYLKETPEGLTAFVGDLELRGAFRHIKMLSMDVAIIQDTSPKLPKNDLFYKMYIKREKVLPFVILLPEKLEEVCEKEENLCQLLDHSQTVSTSLRKLMRSSENQKVTQ
ncbi:MAG: hypothetical protein ACQEWV_20145 [Bacillota bacterium]